MMTKLAKIQYRVAVDADGWHDEQEIIDLTTPTGEVWQIVESDDPYCNGLNFIKDGTIVHYGIDKPAQFLQEEFGISKNQSESIARIIGNIFTVG